MSLAGHWNSLNIKSGLKEALQLIPADQENSMNWNIKMDFSLYMPKSILEGWRVVQGLGTSWAGSQPPLQPYHTWLPDHLWMRHKPSLIKINPCRAFINMLMPLAYSQILYNCEIEIKPTQLCVYMCSCANLTGERHSKS